MATFKQTDEVASNTLIPSSATGGIDKTGWGIDATLSGFIIQSANVTCSRTTDVTQDQKGSVCGELDYDQRWDLQLDVIGNGTGTNGEDASIGVAVGDTAFTWNGKTWKVDSVAYQGSFQDKKRWTITAHRSSNFPSSNPA